jgi:23S rRNA pseudouridine1911/1915/1917 synthase
MAAEHNRGFVYRERLRRPAPGTRALRHLCERYAHSTEAVWRERIEAGHVLLDGEPARPDTLLSEGMLLEWMRPPWIEPSAPTTYTVLHRDEHVLAVAKPAGLPTLPGGGYLENTLLSLVRHDEPAATPVHRLGRWTSGVVLFALTSRARAHLSKALRDGTMWKRYRALAAGEPASETFFIDAPIGPVPHAILGSIHAASPAGRPARSEVRVLERRGAEFLADVVIATGRPHQIRIHLAAAGHPLVGDPLYVAGGVPLPDATALPGDPGYSLHAAEVRVGHPDESQELRIVAPPPAPLRHPGEPI